MDDAVTRATGDAAKPVPRRPKLGPFAHVSVPCRDMAEGKKFYAEVLGGETRVNTPTFAAFMFGDVEVGIGDQGCTFIEPGNEYPHFAFYCDAETIVAMKRWLTACGIPTSNLWTRHGKETLMFFRDPSGNMIELYCKGGYAGAEHLPKGPPRGHGTAVNVDELRYDTWRLPG